MIPQSLGSLGSRGATMPPQVEKEIAAVAKTRFTDALYPPEAEWKSARIDSFSTVTGPGSNRIIKKIDELLNSSS